MLSLLIIFLFHHVAITWSADTVVRPQISLNWTSQTFIIPPGAFPNDTGAFCGTYSKYYCMHAYETRLPRDAAVQGQYGYGHVQVFPVNQIAQPEDHENREEDGEDDLALEYDYNDLMYDSSLAQSIDTLKAAAIDQCFEIIRPIHREHNNYIGHNGCCQYQCDNYLVHGYERMFLTPQEYVDKLTDYSEENKILNLIEAYYNVRCNRNMITKLGFGKGALVRTNHPFGHMPQRYGFPYVLGTSDDLWVHSFAYHSPQEYLTFWWFKHNIICKDQPWVCNETNAEASTSGASRRDGNAMDEIEEDELAEQLRNELR
ncbi:uncharacterized protein LOC142340859 isoform X2 [Convolutriloba macropyga]|uniref:uncharacterized protein LOC142340859 isoform X2 n=1 Tax=Convolutriloba macropyga TaxID=536237 RepID=UPI003F526312